MTIVPADRDPEGRDSKLIWTWRNDPSTRQMSRTTEPIAWDQHAAWYARTEARIVMALVDGERVGMLRFDVIEPGVAEVSINLDPARRGQRLGEPILAAGCAWGFAALDLSWIRAEVKAENAASIKIFERVGFVLDWHHDGSGMRSYQLGRS